MDTDIYKMLMEKAFRYLAVRPRSEYEMYTYLLKKLGTKIEQEQSVLETVIQRLKELTYIDDGKFIAWWIERRQGHNPKGLYAIEQELLQKGIKRDYIREVIGQQIDVPEESVLAKSALGKRFTRWRALPPLECKRKMLHFLQSRGFSFSISAGVVDEMMKKDYNGEV